MNIRRPPGAQERRQTKGTMSKKKKKKNGILWGVLGLLALLILIAAAMMIRRYHIITHTFTPLEKHSEGEWFEIAPEGLVTANGDEVSTRMRLGSENKVIVFFYGGGISINEYTAARPYAPGTCDIDTGFYSPNIEGMIPDWCNLGIGDDSPQNPFSNWTIIVIPYTTADFHIGTGDYTYTKLDGDEAVLHHHGYTNYRAIMDEAIRYVEQPDELLVAGFSAGGYGAAILAEDLMTDYFPDAGHVTVCVDSSTLLLDNWENVFRNVWDVPEKFTGKLQSKNLIVDYLSALYDTYGDSITYLYVGSVRDGALSQYQSYFDTGIYRTNNRIVGVYTAYLKGMINILQSRIPGIGIYIFDRLPYSILPSQFWLTQHTILCTNTVFWPLTNRRSVVSWLSNAVGGRVESMGLDLLR